MQQAGSNVKCVISASLASINAIGWAIITGQNASK